MQQDRTQERVESDLVQSRQPDRTPVKVYLSPPDPAIEAELARASRAWRFGRFGEDPDDLLKGR